MMPSEQSTQAERSQRHRAGVAARLDHIDAKISTLPGILAEMRDIGRQGAALTEGLLDTMADERKGTRQ